MAAFFWMVVAGFVALWYTNASGVGCVIACVLWIFGVIAYSRFKRFGNVPHKQKVQPIPQVIDGVESRNRERQQRIAEETREALSKITNGHDATKKRTGAIDNSKSWHNYNHESKTRLDGALSRLERNKLLRKHPHVERDEAAIASLNDELARNAKKQLENREIEHSFNVTGCGSKVVYLHRRATDGIPFYIGMGELRRAYTSNGRNHKWHEVNNQHGRHVEIICSNLTKHDALHIESALIAKYRRDFPGYITNIKS